MSLFLLLTLGLTTILLKGVFSLFESKPDPKPKPYPCKRCGDMQPAGTPECTGACHIYEFRFRDRDWSVKSNNG